MPWEHTPASRRRDADTYGNPEYRRNKAAVRRRSGGRCEWTDGQRCNSRDRVQCDHKVPVSQGGTHAMTNLWDLCRTHHDQKTASEGGGYRRRDDPEPQPRTQW